MSTHEWVCIQHNETHLKEEYLRFRKHSNVVYLFCRFDENTKLIVVEGAHAVGKTDFAKELADEFGMHFMPPVTMDGYYKDGYGNDLRNYNNLLLPK